MGSRNELKPTVVGRADGGIIPRILVGSRNELKPTIVGRANGGIIPPTWWVYPPYFYICIETDIYSCMKIQLASIGAENHVLWHSWSIIYIYIYEVYNIFTGGLVSNGRTIPL